MPDHWTFYFQGSGLPLSYCATRSGSVYMVHIVLQELLALALMLCQMACRLSGKVVVYHVDNSTAKAY